MTTAALHPPAKVITSTRVSAKREIFNKSKILWVYWYFPPTGFVLNPTCFVINDIDVVVFDPET